MLSVKHAYHRKAIITNTASSWSELAGYRLAAVTDPHAVLQLKARSVQFCCQNDTCMSMLHTVLPCEAQEAKEAPGQPPPLLTRQIQCEEVLQCEEGDFLGRGPVCRLRGSLQPQPLASHVHRVLCAAAPDKCPDSHFPGCASSHCTWQRWFASDWGSCLCQLFQTWWCHCT